MSLSSSFSQISVTRQRDENDVKLLQYAKKNRIDGRFNDVTIQVSGCNISGNRLVLSCFSKTFEAVFQSSTKNKFSIKCDGESVKDLIDYMYTSKINITSSNVMNLLSTADYLKMDDVKTFCFDFFENALTVQNCLAIFTCAISYGFRSPLSKTLQVISENFDKLVQKDSFRNLTITEFNLLVSELDRSKVQEISLYKAILNWVHHEGSREAEFPALFKNLDLSKFPADFVKDEIAEETLVKSHLDCSNAVSTHFSNKVKMTSTDETPTSNWLGQLATTPSRMKSILRMSSRAFSGQKATSSGLHQKASTLSKNKETETKILCVGGFARKSVVEIYDVLGSGTYTFPDLPVRNNLFSHCCLTIKDVIYCIGGKTDFHETNKVYRLNLKTTPLQWEEVASMMAKRERFGATVYNGNIVVVGGWADKRSLNTVEAYDTQSNKWRTLLLLKHTRFYHEIVTAGKYLFAIGGVHENNNRSVERLGGLGEEWKEVQEMKAPREKFAAVNCNGFIYCIGGGSNKTSQTVEKYDPAFNQWSYVRSLNVERWNHAACVLDEKIFVVGGVNSSGGVTKMECYNQKLNQWTMVGETESVYCHCLIAK